MITITPTMLMGPPEAAGARPNLIPVDDVSDAFTAVLSGLQVLLPPGRWDLAEEILHKLEVGDDDWIDYVLDQAGRGRAA